MILKHESEKTAMYLLTHDHTFLASKTAFLSPTSLPFPSPSHVVFFLSLNQHFSIFVPYCTIMHGSPIGSIIESNWPQSYGQVQYFCIGKPEATWWTSVRSSGQMRGIFECHGSGLLQVPLNIPHVPPTVKKYWFNPTPSFLSFTKRLPPISTDVQFALFICKFTIFTYLWMVELPISHYLD